MARRPHKSISAPPRAVPPAPETAQGAYPPAGRSLPPQTLQYVIAALKACGIRQVVVSPGNLNAMFGLIVQQDEFFICHSVVDERSAAYLACGLARGCGEAVALCCTGATASRNYVPALTEAFYSGLPLAVVAFYGRERNPYNFYEQFTDRSVTQHDIRVCQVRLSVLHGPQDVAETLTFLNAALFALRRHRRPVLIECPGCMDFAHLEHYRRLPEVWLNRPQTAVTPEVLHELQRCPAPAVLVGSHAPFTAAQQEALESFARSHQAAVLCDHSSGYHGALRVLHSRAAVSRMQPPELVIDMGGIGNYLHWAFSRPGAVIWRLDPLGEFRTRYSRPVARTFIMEEEAFFRALTSPVPPRGRYAQVLSEHCKALALPELPLSAFLIARELARLVPGGSHVHLAILNACRAANYFEFAPGVECSCNLGGFGIDGALSTAAGLALADPRRLVFALVGDLAFFYDMNILSNRDLPANLRVVMINNHQGIEMKVNHFDRPVVPIAGQLMTAQGHGRSAAGWAHDCGLGYQAASGREEFMAAIASLCDPQPRAQAQLLEVETSERDELAAFDLMTTPGRAP